MSTPPPEDSPENSIAGCILGAAVGDAIGLPLERLRPERAQKLFGKIDESYNMHLCFGRGFVSDDTEHAILTLQAFVASHSEVGNCAVEKFEKELARRLKIWFLQLPPGTGMATAKACLKLIAGVSPQRSGIFSAGNGPAMRAPVLGVVCSDEETLRNFIRVSSRVTHTDPKAEVGALVVALAARFARVHQAFTPREFLDFINASAAAAEFGAAAAELLSLIERVVESVERAESTPYFAASLGLVHGVSGYIFHTVPVVIHAWLLHPDDLRSAVLDCLRCGGDTDSTAAIVGGIIGARVGEKGVPQDWLRALAEWPHGVGWMRDLAVASALRKPLAFRVSDLFVLPRNLLLLLVVLFHGFRRMLPPY